MDQFLGDDKIYDKDIDQKKKWLVKAGRKFNAKNLLNAIN